MIKKQGKIGLKIAILSLAVCSAVFAVGFSAWTSASESASVQTEVSVTADDIQYAGFANLLSKKVIRFDAPTDDNAGRIIYTNDVGGEQLLIDITGTALNYSEIGSINFSGSFDSSHESVFNNCISRNYLVAPVFEELSRKATVTNPTSVGSYWTSDHDTINNTRDFEIIASFSWGSFFNYKNPSVFFDSLETNSENKLGKEYSTDTIKSHLSTIRGLSGGTFTVNLSTTAFTYTVNFLSSDTPSISGLPSSITVSPGESFTVPSTSLSATGYNFLGYSYTKNNTTAEFTPGQTYDISELIALDSSINSFNLYTVFEATTYTLTISVGSNETGKYSITRGSQTIASNVSVGASSTATPSVKTNDVITFTVSASNNYTAGSISTTNLVSLGNDKYRVNGNGAPTITVGNASGGGSCVLPDTLVTMADGTKKPIKDVEPGDMILVMNHETGELDVSPVTFNESDEPTLFNVIHLVFSNGKDIGVISEHGFFDMNTMRYEYIDETNYRDFIGDEFYTEEGTTVTLVDSFVKKEYTGCYELPSFYHLNFFAEGILSIPGGITGLFNIFEYDLDLKYNEEAKARDIETYGLFTYEDLAPLGVTEIMFEAYAGKYLKVALGKGILTEEYLMYLINRYAHFTE